MSSSDRWEKLQRIISSTRLRLLSSISSDVGDGSEKSSAGKDSGPGPTTRSSSFSLRLPKRWFLHKPASVPTSLSNEKAIEDIKVNFEPQISQFKHAQMWERDERLFRGDGPVYGGLDLTLSEDDTFPDPRGDLLHGLLTADQREALGLNSLIKGHHHEYTGSSVEFAEVLAASGLAVRKAAWTMARSVVGPLKWESFLTDYPEVRQVYDALTAQRAWAAQDLDVSLSKEDTTRRLIHQAT